MGDHPDFSPVISVDGNALFYTSRGASVRIAATR
jgi:hypothetical protein